MNPLDHFNFHNTFSKLSDAFSAPVMATALTNPKMVAYSEPAGQLLDLDASEELLQQLVQVCSGNQNLTGSAPVASVYAGHQFGVYVPQLGDGRSLLLGEVKNQNGEKWDLHLKGAGPTPYSRSGDGRAVLRSCIREYLASEALYHLGIPTTRALCVVTSDTKVYRETVEAGSTLLRLAKSHIRFGHFEYFYYTKQHSELKILADYVIQHHFPQLKEHATPYLALFQQVVLSTAQLMAQWQAMGFAHGVMNTDNMSILGDTIDFGPYGFMDDFDWHFICNHSDHEGRYAFSQQPEIGYWNCGRLAQAIVPLIKDTESLQSALDAYPELYSKAYQNNMRRKLGLHEQNDEDSTLLQSLLTLMHKSRCDYTLFFRELSHFTVGGENTALKQRIPLPEFSTWLDQYAERLNHEPLSCAERGIQMRRTNPKYILRNYLAQNAIEKAEQGDCSEVNQLMAALSNPYEEQPEFEIYAQAAPEWGKGLAVSCSS